MLIKGYWGQGRTGPISLNSLKFPICGRNARHRIPSGPKSHWKIRGMCQALAPVPLRSEGGHRAGSSAFYSPSGSESPLDQLVLTEVFSPVAPGTPGSGSRERRSCLSESLWMEVRGTPHNNRRRVMVLSVCRGISRQDYGPGAGRNHFSLPLSPLFLSLRPPPLAY